MDIINVVACIITFAIGLSLGILIGIKIVIGIAKDECNQE